ncbi:dephospho-CoA kinase [Arsenicicoccus piscis]|uniref:Dephospho-CoA kinase n=1 Tax=Arsenicicoccus piscis TaxID=673954 RepID=A0ABQ6HLK0_9MICO|nr:dephospho-CoA kinase [Arsenicicoccus piscis]MCH8626779.1 dephospho-CoA kinase [Arsenicicoccus piscis]MCH8628728.1 dephospho-CoA kinase [Arsenicicoccus piscis]GMA19329.1 dephospho-CoA kinase [Arsenicicoccus piscis]
MLRIGLTGGIGSGKSTVGRRLAELGALVVDADAVAREVVAAGSPGLAAVVERFGPGILAADGSLDREALGEVVFADSRARADLEAITHPLVGRRTAELMAQAAPDQVVVYDVPLLVEKRMGDEFHLVVITDARPDVRLRRLVEQRGMQESDARARMEHQASDEQRLAAADVLLDNNGAQGDLDAQVQRLWDDRIVPFEANLRAREAARRGDGAEVVDYDESWPLHAERAIARICKVLGERAPEIEHIGSTAVPGLDGKDVIDLQVGVSDLRDADDPAFVDALAAIGFPRIEDVRMDHPKEQLPDPSLWVKRYHGASDPGRLVRLHVREMGGAGWQYALLYRDWLRHDRQARDDYLREKQRLAAQFGGTDGYAEAKEPWFSQIWPRMQEWARHSGWKP